MIPKAKLFILIFAPAAIAILVGLALIQDKNEKISEEQFEELLYASFRLAKLSYDQGLMESEDAREKVRGMTRELRFRVTVIGDDGLVKFDSEATKPLENHADRPEIKAAILGHPIFDKRVSETTGEKSMYYAQRVGDKDILRISSPLDYFENQKRLFFRQAAFSAMALAAAVALFSFIASRRQAEVYLELSQAVAAAKGGARNLPTFNSRDLDLALYSLSEAARDILAKNQEIQCLNSQLQRILARIDEGVIYLDGQKVLYRNRRAEEILNCQIPDSTAQIDKKEILSVLDAVKNVKLDHLRIGGRTVFFERTREDGKLLVIFYDQTEKEKYSSYKSDLVGNVSHELKTPLSLVLGAAEVILKDPEMSREYLEKFLAALYRNAQRINSLLDDLIVLHRLESRPEALGEECDLSEIMGEIKEMVDPGDKDVEWKVDEGIVYFHGAHIVSVITNLLSNAVKYSKGQKIIVEVRRRDNFLEISVADSGPKIPENERERIFERFYSISRSRNRERSGSGLGLAIVKHVARVYRGQVKVADNDLGGNTFWVFLTSPETFYLN